MRSEPAAARGGDDSHGNEPSGWPEFLRAWLRNPAQVGAVWPSSPRLSAKLARIAPGHGAPVVVELGPGTGAVTAQVARRLDAENDPLVLGAQLEAKVRDLEREAQELGGRLASLSGSAQGWIGPLSADQTSQRAFLTEMLQTLRTEWSAASQRLPG